ncbi:predicted protein [Naegleria gruberi]|uniref:Predicted protein n=1 Tax=Naegleria gruberi TaxID=5762 RepID=D2UXA8_NAEGR|nr:uncharacterized protein NAEGRDRAFT_61698 [Naegleria gruberi]EFC50600.1 predicted protein [Naegleria gruberi]|eukprot:XP_002683344.1 predicted protein [Naegleria gruberi strain NEG-M]
MILQKQADCIHFSGAITRVAYFQKKLREYVSQERLQHIKKELTPYLKDEFLNKPIPHCQFLCETTGESALLSGAEEMLNSSLENESTTITSPVVVPIIFREANELNTLPVSYLEQFVPAMLYEDESKGKKIEKKIVLRESLLDMYIKQDTEIFLIKFSPLIDTKKITSINFNNFTQVGIIEFLRFTNLIICFDHTKIQTSVLEFFIKLELEEEHLIVKIYYTKNNSFYKSEIRIEKKGRTERISINDSAELIFKTREDESRTWYGVYYDTLSIISASSSVSISKEIIAQHVGKQVAKALKPDKKLLTIPSTHPKDEEFVKKQLAKCAVCRETTYYKTRFPISYKTLPNYRSLFDDSSINIGLCCPKCYNRYRELKK